MNLEAGPAPLGDQAGQAPHHDRDGPAPKSGFVAQVIGNTSLVTALLVYMGWVYENARLAYFHVSALNLNLSIMDYVLHSLSFFLNTNIVFSVIGVILIAVLASQRPMSKSFIPSAVRRAASGISRDYLLVGSGLLVTALAGTLAWFGLQSNGLASWFVSHQNVFYLVVILIGAGALMATWPARLHGRGRLRFSAAVVVAAVCVIWAAGLYANELGIKGAEFYAQHLTGQTAVTVYSVKALSMSGAGVTVQHLGRGSFYGFRYRGLRLLFAQSGTYYLLPVEWHRSGGHTYILNDSGNIRIELY